MHNRQNRKKQTCSNLINFQDFVRYRSQKEKIVTNPFEENWKKAIVLEEMLELYKARQNNYLPAGIYDKKDFSSYYKYRNDHEGDEAYWQNNEDYQLKKYYKMAEGMDSFDKLYQNNRIIKVVKKVEARGNMRIKEQSQEMPKKEKIFATHKLKKYSQMRLSKNKLESFQSLIAFNDCPKKLFAEQKKEIFRLKKKAMKIYGLKFQSQVKSALQDADLQKFKKNEALIYEKFMPPMKNRASSVDEDFGPQQLVQSEPNQNLPDGLLINNKSSCPVSPRRAMLKTDQCSRKKRYLRIL